MLTDLRHLWRAFGRSRASAGAAALTLALTLGAGTAIFAVVDDVLLTPPPFSRPHELYTVGEAERDDAAVPRRVSYTTLEAWRERAAALAVFEAFDGTNLTLTGTGTAQRLQVTDATPGLLTLLGVSPASGRTFTAGDAGLAVAIVSHGFWRTTLGADSQAVGRDIVLSGRPHTVIGVLPESFVFALGGADIWRPLDSPSTLAARNALHVAVVTRLSESTTPTLLADVLDPVSRASTPPGRAVAIPIATAIAGDRATTLTLLAAAAGLAILMAFVNVAGLLVVRSIDRRRELAVRTALGARPSNLVWHVLLESGAIVAVGTVVGIWLGWWGAPAVANLVLGRGPGQPDVTLAVSVRVVGVLTVLSCLFAVLSSVLPVLSAQHGNLIAPLRLATTPTAAERRLRRAFVVGEVALACVLVASMSLLGRALVALLDASAGFDARGVLALQVSLPRASYPGNSRAAAFYSSLQSSLAERLGPSQVGVVDELPLTGFGRRQLFGARPDAEGREAVVRSASASYFGVMRIPVVAGRAFDATDTAAGVPRRVVLSASLAEHLFASVPAVGKTVWLLPGGTTAEVIGVVGDVMHGSLGDAATPTLYESSAQEPSHSSVIVVRSRRPTADVAAIVREEVSRLDAQLPVYRVRPMEEVVAVSPGLPERRLLAAAFAGFALLAVILSAVGLFGVVAHDVSSRRSELGLRVALGASPTRLLLRTLAQGVWLVAVGLTAGSLLSIWAADGLRAAVPGPSGRVDLVNIGLAAAILTVVALAAVFPAALRASRADPLVVLRGE